jgi:predicted nucleic acid-binding protein
MAIASCLVDTNILLRVTRRSDPQHKLVDTTLARLAGQGTALHYTHQNIAELWNAMTRPVARNGLGLSVIDAEREVRAIEAGMSLLPDSEAVYLEWRRIVVQYGVLGVHVHDARLAATMYAHGVSHILTLNVADFSRFSGLTALHPNTLYNAELVAGSLAQ